MATFTKTFLSSSVNGASTLVSASATPGTLIHTAQPGITGLDEVWIYADNSASTSVKLTVEFGGTAEKDQIELSIPGESGLVLVVPGLPLNNSAVVRAFSASANLISVLGYVNRVL
jgi:hypothetical protein